LERFGAHLLAREEDDQYERDHDHASSGVEVKGKRDRQVIARPKAVQQDAGG
jgi:hypothetical protein